MTHGTQVSQLSQQEGYAMVKDCMGTEEEGEVNVSDIHRLNDGNLIMAYKLWCGLLGDNKGEEN